MRNIYYLLLHEKRHIILKLESTLLEMLLDTQFDSYYVIVLREILSVSPRFIDYTDNIN